MAKCTNYCIKGSCSSCGNCCTELLPLTISEVKLIKAYVKEKGIKPYSDVFFKYEGRESTNLMCPFRDFETKKCRIYEVRPKICRLFKCNQDDRTIETHKEAAHKRANYNKTTSPKKPITKVYSMRELIYGDVCDTIRILVGDLVRLNRPVFTQGVINILNAFGREDIAKAELVDKVIDEYKYHDKIANKEEDNAKI